MALLADMKPMAPVQGVPLEEVRTVLHTWLANVQEEPAAYRYGRVFVGNPEQARGRSFEVVFVPGLAERVFPQKLREDPLLLDNLRKMLSPDLRVFGRPEPTRTAASPNCCRCGSQKALCFLSSPRDR